jgi:hypothetical protein
VGEAAYIARAQAMRHLWTIQPPFPAIAAKFHQRSFKLAHAQGMIGFIDRAERIP